MNYKILIAIIFLFVFSCTNQNFGEKKISETKIIKKYSNHGFTLVYTDELFKNKIVNKKLNERDLYVFQKNLKTDTRVKITNLINKKYVIATVKNKSKYPNFYNSVITSRIAYELDLNLNEPFILIESVDENSVFYAGKAKTFDEEKNVADKAPVEGVNIVNISSSNDNKEIVTKLPKKFNYIIKIANFYYEDSAKLVKERIMSKTNIRRVNIDKVTSNDFMLSVGPYKSIKSLKKDFEIIESLYFENLELIKR